MFGFLDFGFLDFWNVGFLDACILDPCGYLHTRNCISVYRRTVRQYYHLDMHHIYIYTCTLAKPGFCSGGNRRIVHCSAPVLIKMMVVKA